MAKHPIIEIGEMWCNLLKDCGKAIYVSARSCCVTIKKEIVEFDQYMMNPNTPIQNIQYSEDIPQPKNNYYKPAPEINDTANLYAPSAPPVIYSNNIFPLPNQPMRAYGDDDQPGSVQLMGEGEEGEIII